MRVPEVWGATDDEVRRRYPADEMMSAPVLALTRAVAVAAPSELVYRWMCQISVAPYSYDLLDNWGHRSPRELTPGADDLHVGQEVMVFHLTDVQTGRQFSGRSTPAAARLFGVHAVTYAVEPVTADTSRLLCRLVCATGGPVARLRGELLAWGDLVMMRKQLLTLAALAERDARRLSRSAPAGSGRSAAP